MFAYWLFFGAGYSVIQPTAYDLSTGLLLSHPATATDAAKAIQDDGYLSIAAQHRLLDRIGSR